jgi:hypothetical protein
MTAALLDRFTILEMNCESCRFRESTNTASKRAAGKQKPSTHTTPAKLTELAKPTEASQPQARHQVLEKSEIASKLPKASASVSRAALLPNHMLTTSFGCINYFYE